MIHNPVKLKNPKPTILFNANANPPPLHIRRSRLLSVLNSLNFRLAIVGSVCHEAVSFAAVEPAGAEVEQFLAESVFFILIV